MIWAILNTLIIIGIGAHAIVSIKRSYARKKERSRLRLL